jgi:hypothetical protein
MHPHQVFERVAVAFSGARDQSLLIRARRGTAAYSCPI